ncbi:MAG: tail fiber domain-containing protein, partial [Bacteroidia bacterium]
TGSAAMYLNTGSFNTATGFGSLNIHTTGSYNTANGYLTLASNTTGSYNVAEGAYAGYRILNVTANPNTIIGANALHGGDATPANNTASDNVAIGYRSMYGTVGSASTGTQNVAVGNNAMRFNTTGGFNTANGTNALNANLTGTGNTAIGNSSLWQNISGNFNVSVGFSSLANTTGNYNTGVGEQSLSLNTTGNYNSAFGNLANVSIGTLTNATAIGYNSAVNASNKVRIGNTTVTVVEGPVAYTFSDGRFKTNVTEEVQGLAFITKLRPVVYNLDTRKVDEFLTKNMPDSIRAERMKNQDYKPSTAIRQSGFIAQEVEQAAKAIGYNFNGVHIPENENDNYSVSYQTIVVPLVKAVQEQQQTIELLLKRIEALEKK